MINSDFVEVTEGAQGETLEQLRAGLKYPELEHMKKGYSTLIPTLRGDKAVTIGTANAIFLQANHSSTQQIKFFLI
jgi:hypothetical protein